MKRQKQTDFIDGVVKNIATDKKYFDQCLTETTGKLCNIPLPVDKQITEKLFQAVFRL